MIDGKRRYIDLDEVTAAMMQRRSDRESLLAQWTMAELELSARARPETSPDRTPPR